MKVMLVAMVVVGMSIGADTKQDAVKEELKRLEGTWAIESVEREGKKDTDKDQWIFKEGKLATKSGITKRISPIGPISIDPTKKPKTIDIVIEVLNKKKMPGIYELKDDTLRICYGGTERPKELASKGGHAIMTFQRVKP